MKLMRKSQLRCLFILCLSIYGLNDKSLFSSTLNDPPTTKPNVIIIMTDDQGYGELSVHGNPILNTPNLDKLYHKSTRLTNFHVAPMCTPTRGQLITGIDAVRNGAVNVSSGRTLLRSDIPTMGDFFSEAGYKTGIFGKWHLGDNYPFRPEDRGFMETLWFPSSHIGSVPDYWENDYFDDTYIRNGEKKQYSGYCTDVFFSEAKSWMKENKNQPFLTYLPTNAPHQPFYALESDILEMEKIVNQSDIINMDESKKHNFIRYLAMIKNIDDNVGELIQFLNDENLFDNTIIVFMTDNGSTFGPDYYNAGMRGRKTQLYEGGHRVPFFISWPNGNIKPGAEIDELTQVQDVLPTLLNLCDIPVPNYVSFDGMNLASAVKGKSKIDDDRHLIINYSRMPFYFSYPSPFANSIIEKNGAGVLWKNWRLLENKELYNLEKDPLQKNNIIDQYPLIANKLRGFLDVWWGNRKETANIVNRVIIGSEHENPSLISACEWVDVFVDQQTQIMRGVRKNSYWVLEVESKGEYEFELRRWPRELNMAINNAGNGYEKLPITFGKIYVKGNGFEFNGRKKIDEDTSEISFRTELDKGLISLHTWFGDELGEDICGAYYVYVTKLE